MRRYIAPCVPVLLPRPTIHEITIGEIHRIGNDTKTIRIVTECFNNLFSHAKCQKVGITARYDHTINVTITYTKYKEDHTHNVGDLRDLINKDVVELIM